MHVNKYLQKYFALETLKSSDAKATDGKNSEDRSRDSKGKEGKVLIGANPMEKNRGNSLELPQIHSGLARMVVDPQAALADLQSLILAERTSGHKTSNDYKHYYTVVTGSTVANGTVTNHALTNVSAGTASNNRTSDVLESKSLTISFSIARTYTGDVTTGVRPPTIRVYIWRDKVPATPGTATATLGTDANPPASNVILWSRVGSSSIATNLNAIINPDTEPRYHIYHTEQFHMPHRDVVENGGTTIEPAGYVHHKRYEFNLNKVEISFTSAASSDPIINPIYLSYFSDFDYTSVNFTDVVTFISDYKYVDKQQ